MDEVEKTIWQFLRGDIGAQEFESWVYTSESIEIAFGPDMYLELLSAGYRDEHDLADLMQLLRKWLDEHSQRACDCITWKRHELIPLGFDTPVDVFFSNFSVLRQRNPWLDMVRCKICQQAWYIATDSVDEEYHLLRLTEDEVREVLLGNTWPDDFDNLKNVWPNSNPVIHL